MLKIPRAPGGRRRTDSFSNLGKIQQAVIRMHCSTMKYTMDCSKIVHSVQFTLFSI